MSAVKGGKNIIRNNKLLYWPEKRMFAPKALYLTIWYVTLLLDEQTMQDLHPIPIINYLPQKPLHCTSYRHRSQSLATNTSECRVYLSFPSAPTDWTTVILWHPASVVFPPSSPPTMCSRNSQEVSVTIGLWKPLDLSGPYHSSNQPSHIGHRQQYWTSCFLESCPLLSLWHCL